MSKILLLIIALLLVGCGENKVEPPKAMLDCEEFQNINKGLMTTISSLQNQLDDTCTWLGPRDSRWLNKLFHADVWSVDGTSVVRHKFGSYLIALNGMNYIKDIDAITPYVYFTKREADSALCVVLQARIDSLECK